MRRGGRITLIVVGCILGVVAVVFVVGTMSFGIPRQDDTVGVVDFARVPDGTYAAVYRVVPPFGKFAVYRRVSVEVAVSGGKVTGIRVVSPEEMRENLQPLVDRVVDEQSLQVDAITAGSWSSKALLKAVETAVEDR